MSICEMNVVQRAGYYLSHLAHVQSNTHLKLFPQFFCGVTKKKLSVFWKESKQGRKKELHSPLIVQQSQSHFPEISALYSLREALTIFLPSHYLSSSFFRSCHHSLLALTLSHSQCIDTTI